MDEPIDLDRDDLLTLSEAARRLKIDPATVYRWALKGKLRCWRRGGRLVTTKRAVDALLVPLARPGAGPAFGQAERARHSQRTEEVLREAGML